MTAGGDFIPSDSNEVEGQSYPKLFGLNLTPTVIGIILALLGLGAALWLWLNVVQPTMQRNQELKQDIANKEQDIANQEETQQQIEQARARLTETQQLQSEVLSLFATDRSVDTLLLDVNERVQSANAGIQNADRRATLAKFDLNAEASGLVTDGSYGDAVNNKLERRVYDVSIEGSFPQVVSIIRSIERLQPLLVVSNLNAQLDPATQKLVLDNQGRVANQPETRITTTFQLAALVPTEEATAPETAPPATPEASPSPTQ